MTVRVLVADDHAIVREGIRLILEGEPDMEVVGEATDGLEAVALAEALDPDVVCMDLSMPGLDGIEATRRIRRARPSVRVLALTVHDSDEYFFEMLQAGASGYLPKGASARDLVQAVRVVHEGGTFLYPTVARRLVDDFVTRASDREAASAVQPLTEREREIIRLIGDGLDNRAIAERLVISISTVQTHVGHILEKLGLDSRNELLRYAIRHGLRADDA
jgi:two-component system response regulator NreC